MPPFPNARKPAELISADATRRMYQFRPVYNTQFFLF